jgi:hypothetical protein
MKKRRILFGWESLSIEEIKFESLLSNEATTVEGVVVPIFGTVLLGSTIDRSLKAGWRLVFSIG